MTEQDNPLEGMEEVIEEFLAESAEGLDQMDNDLIALEADPANHELLASIFRTIHSIKGTCGFFGFSRLESVSHAGENLLSRLRDRELDFSQEIATVLLSLGDAVREMLTAIESANNDGKKDYADLVATLARLAEGPGRADDGAAHGERTSPVRPTAARSEGEPQAAAEIPPEPSAAAAKSAPAPDPTTTAAGLSAAESTIRVDVDILDNLMNLVGELVLARNQILAHSAIQQDPLLTGACQRLNSITGELQQDVMKTRMQPINTIWNKFPRVVRDLAKHCGKQVRIEMEGKETELDKSLIEAIKDPLTHLIRNAVDHGVESPDDRVAKGKSAEGCVSLTAYHGGGQVIIEIADDGAGIDVDRLREKAIALGMITTAQATQMPDQDICRLIFAPGMTTAKKVTNISGRGVGMDVVRTNLEKIGGFIELESKRDRGSTFRIQLPLTLAIVPALLVRSGKENFAIPQGGILELIRMNPDTPGSGIESIHGVPVFRLRGKLLPLIYLHQELNLGAAPQGDQALNIVVLQADTKKFGLVVDAIEDSTEIVVKPLCDLLKALPVYAGATITGDGKVALILDVLGVAKHARLLSEHQERFSDVDAASSLDDHEDRCALIIATTSDGGRIAIPMDSVVRLEEFKRTSLEHTGNRTVVQYGREILPLIELTDLLRERRRKPRLITSDKTSHTNDAVHALVYSVDECSVGVVVDRIQDIVEQCSATQGPPTRKGTLGTIVVNGKITEVFDIAALQREVSTMRKRPKRAAAVGEG